MLDESLARQIVEELEQVLEQNINMMNNEGLIIASRDRRRIGTFHEGALNVIKEARQISVYPTDTLQGSKPGVNMPIMFHDKLVGVIGITGHPDEVGAYGKIIKKMTEVMIHEEFAKRELHLETRTKQLFYHEWLTKQCNDSEAFRLRGQTLSIDVDVPRYSLLFQINATKPFSSEIERQQWIDSIRDKLQRTFTSHKNDLSFPWRADQFVILKYSEQKDPMYINSVKKAVLEFNRKGDYVVTCGMGRMQTCLEGIVQSFAEAEQALYFTEKRQTSFLPYRELGIESLVHQIPKEKQDDFIQRFFPFFFQEEHRELVETLRVYFAEDQSVMKTSKVLFIHKNTVQYRLKKIMELSSYDPRKLQDAALYVVALALYDSRDQ